jgi:hypothetical protein
MVDVIKPDTALILKSAKNILLVDWPNPGVPRALLNAGFTVFGYSPDRYSVVQVVAELPQGIDGQNYFSPRTKDGDGYLIFQKLYNRPDFVDIVNVYRPEEEISGIVANLILPLGAKVLWLHPPVTSALGSDIASKNGLIFIEGVDIAEIAAKI